ncbi:hypothetical protein [Okeania sp. SIO3I5]|uniref:hypothetical protein n=1 Tax=Okeania sp. SIO3I5 TaxID=2607805 RepID=UPI0025F256F7|nr:hypothetical protein [Okeania sp. SIO3I5]
MSNSYGKPVTEALLDNDSRGMTMMKKLKSIAPSNHPVISLILVLLERVLWLLTRIF